MTVFLWSGMGIATMCAVMAGIAARIIDRATPHVEFTAMPFDPNIWKSSPSIFSWESIRLRMVDDLLQNVVLQGKSAIEVDALLGPPDDTPYFAAPNHWVYHLGQERHPFGIDSEWLLLVLDLDDCVAQAKIVRD